jgi:hypothetical protein
MDIVLSHFRSRSTIQAAECSGAMTGDAAHIHSALGGQGMNTGLGDAFNLGWKLSLVTQNRASVRLLDTSQAERRPVAADVVKNTSRAWDTFLGRTLFDRLFRDLLFLTVMRMPAVQRRWVDSGSQLRVTYRGSSLTRAAANSRLRLIFRRGPVAGDRGPDAPCRLLPAGTPTTLGEQARARWTLLLFGGAATDQRSCVRAACRLSREQQHHDPPPAGRSRRLAFVAPANAGVGHMVARSVKDVSQKTLRRRRITVPGELKG